MPKAFDSCRKNGGKIRTRKLKDGKYQHLCILNGKTYTGEVKQRKANEGQKVRKIFESDKRGK